MLGGSLEVVETLDEDHAVGVDEDDLAFDLLGEGVQQGKDGGGLSHRGGVDERVWLSWLVESGEHGTGRKHIV